MKWLFIIFLLFNICYFGWELDRQTHIEVSNSVKPFIVPANVQQLMLLTELDSSSGDARKIFSVEDQIETDIEEPVEGELIDAIDSPLQDITSMLEQGEVMIAKKIINELVSDLPIFSISHHQEIEKDKMLCISFGPFIKSAQAVELGNWFKKNEIWAKQRTEGDKKDQLFWIYLSPSDSKDEAMAVIEDLGGKGVKDYKLINKGSLQNAISLGLFSSQAAVNSRLNELKNIGYLPIMVPYDKTQSITWVDAKVNKQRSISILPDFFNGYPSRFNSIPVKCEELFTT